MMKIHMKSVLASLGIACAVSLSAGVEATTCTITNWSSAQELTDANAGTPSANNRRYAGPCGLRVPVSVTPAYVQDDSPASETSFNVRFYFFLNGVTGDVTIFSAKNASNDEIIKVTYDQSADAINVAITHNSTPAQTLVAEGVSAGWNSLEIQWSAATAESVKVILANASITDEVDGASVNTSGLTIDKAQLGVLGVAIGAAGSIDFDDYDSRRDTVPGRVCRGLTDPSRVAGSSGFQELKFEDIDNIFSEIASRGASPSAGVPDYNQDGEVRFSDLDAVFARIASRQVSCAVNS